MEHQFSLLSSSSSSTQCSAAHIYPPQALVKFDGMKGTLEGFILYTDRHFQRLSRLQQLASFVEYTWQRMKLPEQIEPAEVEKGMEEDMSISGTADQLQCEQDRAASVSCSPVITAAADSTTSELGGSQITEDDERREKEDKQEEVDSRPSKKERKMMQIGRKLAVRRRALRKKRLNKHTSLPTNSSVKTKVRACAVIMNIGCALWLLW